MASDYEAKMAQDPRYAAIAPNKTIDELAAANKPQDFSAYQAAVPNQPPRLASMQAPLAYMQERGIGSSYVAPDAQSQYRDIINGQNRGLSNDALAQLAASIHGNSMQAAQRQGLSGYNPGMSTYGQQIANALYQSQAQQQARDSANQALGQYAQYQMRGSQMDAARQAQAVQDYATEQARRETFNENARRFGFQAARMMYEQDVATYQNWARKIGYNNNYEEMMNMFSPGSSAREEEKRLGSLGSGYNPAIPRGY